MKPLRYSSLPAFTCFSYRNGPLHLVNPESGISLCKIECNPHSILNAAQIKRYHQPRKHDTICRNCDKIKNPKYQIIESLPNIPDCIILPFTQYQQLVSEYLKMESNFDPASFLDATIDQPSTRRPPLPAGKVYQGTITDLKSRSWQGKKDVTQSGVAFDVVIKVQVTDPEEQATQGTNEVTLQDSIMLNMTPAGLLDNSPGKNNQLRRYREALGMNEPGIAFVPRQMIGRALLVKIKHEPYQGEMYDKIDSVARIS